MIDPTPGWHCEVRRSGLVLTPPEGKGYGSILYREQLRPLRSLFDAVRAHPAPSEYRPGRLGEVERLLTVEAEHAAIAIEPGSLDGAPAERVFGVVFGDDFYSLVVAMARRPDQRDRFRAEVRRLVEHDTYMLGARRRRFVHLPPSGWHGFAAGLHTTWAPVDYPRANALLTVHPALPVPDGDRGFAASFTALHLERLLGDADVSARGLVTAAGGLSGAWWEALGRGGAESRDIVVLEDDRYIYPLVLECAAEQRAEHLAAFERVVTSVEAIPHHDRPAARASAEAFAMWAE